MKKNLLTLAVAGMTLCASAQEKGRFEVHDLGNFKLHVYYTNDALGDASSTSPNWERRSRNVSLSTM